MKYYAYRFMTRQNDFNMLQRSRRLFQIYAVDMYAKVETERLLFIRREQSKLRADQYCNLQDAMLAEDGDANNIGQRVILPASFTGGPRYMNQKQQDVMAYVRKFGGLTFFITFTANPKWKEITEAAAWTKS